MNSLVLYISALLISFAVQGVVIVFFGKMALCIDDVEMDKPQRFHDTSTPRAGGLGIFFASFIGLSLLSQDGVKLALASIPFFLVGFFEDVRPNLRPRIRFVLLAAVAIPVIYLLNIVVYDIDQLRLVDWIAWPFTVIAIVGVTNSINLIDGFNGLASGVSIIAFVFFALTAALLQDWWMVAVCTVLISSIMGFLPWNFPRGKIFLGDGGAYLVGALLSIISIILIKRHTSLSAWYPGVVLAHPIFDSLFSIYRRRIIKNRSPFEPDRAHLHSLVYKRVTRNNPMTSVYIWILVLTVNVIAFPFRSNSQALIFIFLLFMSTYIYIYRRIVRFEMGKMAVR